jgi:hypothetical protein
LILGTTTWRDAFRNLGTSILASFVDLGAKIVITWAKNQLTMTGATAAGTASRVALEIGAAVKSVALWAATAIKNIATFAWEAAAGAYKAIAGIPFVGPFLAPAAAIAAALAVGSFAKNIVSAQGGYDVPAETFAVLHPKEMVLPEGPANVLRGMADGDGAAGTVNHFHIKAWDGRSVEQMFLKHGTALGRGIQNHVRNFGMQTVT